MTAADKIAEAMVTQAELDAGGIVGVIRTSRHDVVRYCAGWEVGDVFGRDSDYDGPTLTLEVADAADAQAMLDAISNADALAHENARLRSLLDDARLRLVLGYAEDTAPAVIWAGMPSWLEDKRAALRATP